MKPGSLVICVLVLSLLFGTGKCGFLVASSPTEKRVYYARLPSATEAAAGKKMAKHTLLSSNLEKPMGVAIDSLRKVLYIADPGAQTVLAAHIFEHNFPSGHLTLGYPEPVMQDVNAHWVAVDALGTLFCSDADSGHIWSMPASAISAVLGGLEGARARSLYSVDTLDPLNRPQGLAADGFHVFWANGQPGQGTVVRGLVEPLGIGGSSKGDVLQLADNVDEAFGVCLSSSRVFYTARTQHIYSMQLGGGVPISITDSLQEPRGCAFDGDSTIYVADAQEGQIYAFAGGFPRKGQHRLVPSLRVPGAYGVAVFVSGAAGSARMPWLACAAVLYLACAARP